MTQKKEQKQFVSPAIYLMKTRTDFHSELDFMSKSYLDVHSMELQEVVDCYSESARIKGISKSVLEGFKVNKSLVREKIKAIVHDQLTEKLIKAGDRDGKISSSAIEREMHKNEEWKAFMENLEMFSSAYNEFDSQEKRWEVFFQAKRTMHVSDRKAMLGG